MVPCVSCHGTRAGLDRPSSQSARCCRTRPVTALPCAHPCPLQGFPKMLLLSAFQEDSPQAVKEPREVRTRAKSHILERELLLYTQVSALLTGAVSVPGPSSRPQLPPQAPAPATSKSLLPALWVVGMCEPHPPRVYLL